MKKILIALFSFIMLLSLSACSGNKLSESFDEDTVKSKAEEIITAFSDGNYETITRYVSESIADKLTPDVLESAKAQVMPDAGKLDSFSSESVIGKTDSSTKEDMAIAVVTAQYENKKVTYTLSFNTDMQLIGFYLK